MHLAKQLHTANGMFYARFMPFVEYGVMTALFLRSALLSALVGWAFAGPLCAESEPQATRVSAFSGKPVPRFESLRYSAVHGRQGPSLDHPILWRYEKEGLPMLVVRETHGWRRVRDRDGDEVWVQARMLLPQRNVVTISEAMLRRKPDDAAKPIAALKAGVVAGLESCGPEWCEVSIRKRKGWIEKSALWGVETSTDNM